MSLYRRYVLPHLIDAAMSRHDIAELRALHVPAARGVVLEVGIGSGLNLPFYTVAVTKLYGVDTSDELLAMARERAQNLPFAVELLRQAAEDLPLPSASVDTVVVTWALCSIGDPGAALREMRRVLREGGELIFLEHGLSGDPAVGRWQNYLTPLWRHVAGGCHLNRQMDALVRAAGFRILELRTRYVGGPRFATFMFEGRGRAIDERPGDNTTGDGTGR